MRIETATLYHVPLCNLIARECESAARGSLGWVLRDNMIWAISKSMMNVALIGSDVVGFVMWSVPTRGENVGWHVIHTLVVDPEQRRRGFGRALLASVPAPARLKCPAKVVIGMREQPNAANTFYATCGMTLAGMSVTKGGNPLNVWERA